MVKHILLDLIPAPVADTADEQLDDLFRFAATIEA